MKRSATELDSELGLGHVDTKMSSGYSLGITDSTVSHRSIAVPPSSSGSMLDHRLISAWAYVKDVSSWTWLHYLWRSLGPFGLSYAQQWP